MTQQDNINADDNNHTEKAIDIHCHRSMLAVVSLLDCYNFRLDRTGKRTFVVFVCREK